MTETVLLAIGTRKGLWLAVSRDDRVSWEVSGPHHLVTDVYAVGIDTRRSVPRLLVGLSNEHFGPKYVTSDDLGRSWQEREPIVFPEDTGAALARVWQFAPGPDSQPEVVYAGVEPHALFRSTDGGESFELVRGLWEHPHREQWGPGAGGAAIHTVLPHPTDHDRVTVAMSSGGVYSTVDSGDTWAPRNKGVKAYFLPDQYPEFNQCVHKVARHTARPEQLFLQNHHGVYRSDDEAGSWQSIADGLPSDFGFPIVAHPHRPGVVYNFPLTADIDRYPPDGACRVYRSEDAGTTWTALTEGLPQEGFWSVVLRDAFCADNAESAGLYFGSRSGEVYGSRDEGDSWQLIAAHLPDVLCVRAAVV